MKNHQFILKLLLVFVLSIIINGCCIFKGCEPPNGNEEKITFERDSTHMGYGKIIRLADENSVGLITLFSNIDKHPESAFLYEYIPKLNNLKLDDTIKFNVKYSDIISFAYNIEQFEGDTTQKINEFKVIRKYSKINPHNRFHHSYGSGSHTKGHLSKGGVLSINYNNINFTDGTFNTSQNVWFPSFFDPKTCADTNSIWVYFAVDNQGNTVEFQDRSIIIEVGCTHEQFHQN